MNQNSFIANRVKIIVACYLIQSNINTIQKALHSIPESDAANNLKKYLLDSKVFRFKPYLEKVIADIREIKP